MGSVQVKQDCNEKVVAHAQVSYLAKVQRFIDIP